MPRLRGMVWNYEQKKRAGEPALYITFWKIMSSTWSRRPLPDTLLPYVQFFESDYGQTNEKYKENSRKISTADRKPITYSRASNFGSKNEMWFIGIIPWFDGLGRLRYLDLDSILQACIGIARFFLCPFPNENHLTARNRRKRGKTARCLIAS